MSQIKCKEKILMLSYGGAFLQISVGYVHICAKNFSASLYHLES